MRPGWNLEGESLAGLCQTLMHPQTGTAALLKLFHRKQGKAIMGGEGQKQNRTGVPWDLVHVQTLGKALNISVPQFAQL